MSELLSCFNPLPYEQWLTDSLCHDPLKIRDSLRFNPLSLGFLPFLLQYELHPPRLLFGSEFFLDCILDFRGKPDIPDHHLLNDETAAVPEIL